MGSPCLFTRQQALKMGYFYRLRVKSLNHLHTELNLGFLKGTKFCLESKATFIDISSIESEMRSSQEIFQFKQLERRSLKKSGLQRDSNP